MLNRRTAWAPVGIDITGCNTIDEALRTSELDFNVVKNPIYDIRGEVIPNRFATTRTDDNSVLGIVGNRYEIVQNREAFDFTDNLIPEGMVFERAGIWKQGSAMWVEAKLPHTYNILGDDVDTHIVFINSHDGRGSIRVSVIPNRIVCSNQINFAVKRADRNWTTVHSSKISDKIRTAKETLEFSDIYMNELTSNIDYLASKKISDAQFDTIINNIYQLDPSMSDRRASNILTIKEGIQNCLQEEDVINFKDSAWGRMCAVTDYFDHSNPLRNTDGFDNKRWESIANGHPVVDRVFNALMVA